MLTSYVAQFPQSLSFIEILFLIPGLCGYQETHMQDIAGLWSQSMKNSRWSTMTMSWLYWSNRSRIMSEEVSKRWLSVYQTFWTIELLIRLGEAKWLNSRSVENAGPPITGCVPMGISVTQSKGSGSETDLICKNKMLWLIRDGNLSLQTSALCFRKCRFVKSIAGVRIHRKLGNDENEPFMS